MLSGVDADGTEYLRYTLPVPEEMDEALFVRQFATALSLMSSFVMVFVAPVFAVINGECTARNALEKVKQQLDMLMDLYRENGVVSDE